MLAGPGSGKTRVITARLTNLITHHNVSPSSILTITFTKKAAEEMRSRAERQLGNVAGAISFGTFHSMFFKILRNTYRFGAENIAKPRIQSEMVRECIESEKIDLRESDINVIDILSEISKAKTLMEPLEQYHSVLMSDEEFYRFYKRYTGRMNQLRLIDFDDMLIRCHDLFLERPAVLKRWQEKFRFIMIDEFQDIDRMQYETVRMLAGDEANIMVVGDDDQSIYQFRGANSSIMKDFLKDYPESKLIRLSINYRSAKNIVKASGSVISQNKERFDKNIKANSEISGKVQIEKFENRKEEIDALVNYLKKESDLQECAILLRTNTLASAVAEELMMRNIKVDHAGRVSNSYEHFIAKDILTYLKIASGESSRTDMYRIMNKPYRYISRNAIPDEKFDFDIMKRFHEENIRTYGAISML